MKRCDVCGWPLCASREDGCTADSCSMRPRPSPTYRERLELREWIERALDAEDTARDLQRRIRLFVEAGLVLISISVGVILATIVWRFW